MDIFTMDGPSVPCPWHMVMGREDHPVGAPPCWVPERPAHEIVESTTRHVNMGQLMIWLSVQATEAAEAYTRIYESTREISK